MESNKIETSKSASADIPDLERLLQKCLSSDRLRLIERTVAPLLAVGENFASDMVKIVATIRRKPSDSAIEKLHLVAKTMSTADRPLVNWSEILPKEVFVFTDLIPTYRSVERKAGIKEEDLIDILPTYVGHRFSVDDSSTVVDENGLLLMENLQVKGYFNADKRLGVNADYAKRALSSLARYHALGIVVKRENPAFFERVREFGATELVLSQMMDSCDDVLQNIKEIPRFDEHARTIQSSFSNASRIWSNSTAAGAQEPWVTVIHGDFWMNNILFHEDRAGKVDDVKFVDFQTYSCNSPSKDVLRFLSCNLNDDTCENFFDNLIDHYYEECVKHLRTMGCDTAPFSRESFDEDLKITAVSDFPLFCLTAKFFSHEIGEGIEDSSEIISSVRASECSEDGKRRLLQLLNIYEKKNWF